MSQSDDDFYRGDPPVPGQQPGYAPAQYGATPGYGPPAGQNPPPGYGAPAGYGPPPGYGPPGYGPPPGYGVPGQPVFVVKRPTNSTAILALVFAFVFAPAGLILGIVARRQIRQTGEDGDGMALAGIVIGSIAVALYAVLILIWVVALVSITSY